MATAMRCEEAEQLIALAVLGALERDGAGGLESHLATCAGCRETVRAFRRAAAVLPQSLEEATPSRQLRRRLMGAVYAGSATAPARPRRVAGLWRRVPQARGFTLAAALAAAAAVALAVWGATRGPAAQTETFAVVPAAAPASAHGELTYFPGQGRSVLTVSGLGAPSRDGSAAVYEVWLVPRSGAPAPAAFMSPVPGSGSWTAVVSGDLRGYQAIAATVEPPGGEPQPTGAQEFVVPLSQT